MTLTTNDLYIEIRRKLRSANISMAELEARELAAFASNLDKKMTANWAYCYLDTNTIENARKMTDRRLAGEPLAYIIGEWDFYGYTFKVNKNVLIPRSDTEIMCELAIQDAQNIETPRILDLCCGSGCIGISLAAQVKTAKIVAADISEEALSVARENARKIGITQRYITTISNALEKPSKQLGKFDIMLCNPPYITSEEMKKLDKSVLDYEPHIALFGGHDGLDFYKNIAENWVQVMNTGGRMYFECGYQQSKKVTQIFAQYGMNDVFIANDLAGIERVIVVKAKK